MRLQGIQSGMRKKVEWRKRKEKKRKEKKRKEKKRKEKKRKEKKGKEREKHANSSICFKKPRKEEPPHWMRNNETQITNFSLLSSSLSSSFWWKEEKITKQHTHHDGW